MMEITMIHTINKERHTRLDFLQSALVEELLGFHSHTEFVEEEMGTEYTNVEVVSYSPILNKSYDNICSFLSSLDCDDPTWYNEPVELPIGLQIDNTVRWIVRGYKSDTSLYGIDGVKFDLYK